MAVSPQIFPQRKRRPPAGAFITPKFSDRNLVTSLLVLSQEISCLKPIDFLVKRNSLSIIRKTKLLSILFEELLRNPIPYSSSALLCFEEMYIILQRIKTLIEDCSFGSKTWLLAHNQSVSNNFHELTLELSTLLDVFPIKEVSLSEDVVELVVLIKKQCSEARACVDPRDDSLRREVLAMLDGIKREIVPDHSKLQRIFHELGIRNSLSCGEEIESLEEEVQNQVDEKSKSEVVALIGLVLYAKCVLYGTSTPGNDHRRRKPSPEVNIPVDFRCPITLEMMREPVVVATGQTYDQASINLWIESGHNTCPKTGQTLAHTNLTPNVALKNLIAMWCRDQKIPFQDSRACNGVSPNKAAREATKMTVTFLVNKLSVSRSLEAANDVVYELRALAKTNSHSRTCIAEAGALPLLVRYLDSEFPNLQVNAVTAILNLSILEQNKKMIMETDGALNGVVEVLCSGSTWDAKGNAAATIFSLSGVHVYRKKLGRKTRVIRGLLDLVKTGPTNSKRDALVAILNLCGDRETVGRFVDGGVVVTVTGVMSSLPEEAVTVLEAVVKRGGIVAVAEAQGSVKRLGLLLREGSETARESAAAALVTMCGKGGAEIVAELAAMAGIERMIWELMGSGTTRGKRKAAALLRILRRWAAGLDGDFVDGYRTVNTALNASSSRTVLST
ncbi:hypothetical protein K2173_000086 [Erythroxylum novogranatense]|uniref:RING-type E3 ubiquitin transferase n=1 Tax=Erythroxylum novogranatense TaxID=1862640 RepID=A0AAV8SNE5_9ROSI|nr:hypothetical protein K2173_000086 [Erythroxylum novogranatense]